MASDDEPVVFPDTDLDLEDLDITSRDGLLLDIVNGHIRENLEDELVQEALKTGVDLRHYSLEVERELRGVEALSITDYIRESKKIAHLHKEMKQCDFILSDMEQMLGTFQQDLGSISTEIQVLQEKSIEMSVKLYNRKNFKDKLSEFLDRLIVTPKLIEIITTVAVTDQVFVKGLAELDSKLLFVEEQQHTLAAADVTDVLDKLKIKAIIKIRYYILEKINEFKRPMSNYEVIQQTLLKYKYFYEFLQTHSLQTASEIKTEYIDTLSKVYYSYFKTYQTRLIKFEYEECPTKNDVMGAEDSGSRRYGLSMFSSAKSIKSKSTVFTLGNRDELIEKELEWPVISPTHLTDKQLPYEAIFRSIQYGLIENVCGEYNFVTQFFRVKAEKAQDVFTDVMGRTLSLIHKSVETYMENCFDCIGIMLCAHIVMNYHTLMKKRNLGALVGFHNKLLQVLWPRFNYVLSLSIHSVRETDPSKLAELDTRPHFITRRFGEFYSAIHTLNDRFPNEQTVRSMLLLQSEVENVILRMAAEFQDRQDQLVFLINNYDLMLSVMLCRASEPNKEALSVQDLLNRRINEFVDEILSPYFGGMISFVKDTEKKLENGGAGIPLNETYITQLVRGFTSDYKRSIESINTHVMKCFTNFKNGTIILQSALTKMVQYYNRFQKILSQPPFKTLPCKADMVNIHHVMVEVKKYKNQF